MRVGLRWLAGARMARVVTVACVVAMPLLLGQGGGGGCQCDDREPGFHAPASGCATVTT